MPNGWHWFGTKMAEGLVCGHVVMSWNHIYILRKLIKYECEKAEVLHPRKLENQRSVSPVFNLTALTRKMVVWEIEVLPLVVTKPVPLGIKVLNSTETGVVYWGSNKSHMLDFCQDTGLWEHKKERLASWKVIPHLAGCSDINISVTSPSHWCF